MNCPKCQSKAVVVDSRKYKTGEVYRRRCCVSCGYRFSTLEAVVKYDRFTMRE